MKYIFKLIVFVKRVSYKNVIKKHLVLMLVDKKHTYYIRKGMFRL